MDQVEEPETDGEDLPIKTVGGVLQIYSALPPWGERLPREIDEAHFEEVRSIVEALRRFSSESDHEIAIELDDVQVGWIERGKVGKSIEEGLLGEWRRKLDHDLYYSGSICRIGNTILPMGI